MDVLPTPELERRLSQLDRLLAEMIAGDFSRTTFQPWEVEILLDIQSCATSGLSRKQLLKRYQKAAHRWFCRGGRTLLLLSDYMSKRHRRTPPRARAQRRSARFGALDR